MNGSPQLPHIDDAASMGKASRPSESDKVRAMVDALSAAGRRSTAEVMHELRRAFPHSPLAVRVRALEALRRR